MGHKAPPVQALAPDTGGHRFQLAFAIVFGCLAETLTFAVGHKMHNVRARAWDGTDGGAQASGAHDRAKKSLAVFE